jgi:RiboL-PSP-HEPN
MASQSSTSFHANKKDVEMLWHIHAEVAGSGKGRKHRADVLNRTAIVFISACWESYIEDVCMEGFDLLLCNIEDPNMIPSKVKTIAARELRNDKDERRIWELAGLGWKNVLSNHKDVAREVWLKDFNTPKSKQVRALFSDLLGIADITSNWNWPDMTAETARAKLDRFISIRGNIAHRIKHEETVHKSWDKEFLTHVTRLVDLTDEALNHHLSLIMATSPW